MGGELHGPKARSIYTSGELAVTSRRLILLNDVGFMVSKPIPILFVPLNAIVAIGTKIFELPLLPPLDKGLVITYKIGEELYHMDLSIDLDPSLIKSQIEEQVEKLKQSTAKKCPHCGASNVADAVFCAKCGRSLT